MLYFLYMTTLLSNTIFHHNLQKGTIEYNNTYPFVEVEHQMLETNISNNSIEELNISLLDAQKYIVQRPNYVGFTFDASDNVTSIQDISRGTIGNAYFFKDNSTLTSATDRVVYLIKNNGMTESQYTEPDNNYYFGDLDRVTFKIPQTDISSIHQTIDDLSQNLTYLSRFIPADMISEVTDITIQPLGNHEVYVDYYLYIWEDLNGPWFNGSSLSMTPNNQQLTDSNYTIRPITFNDISNQEQIEQTNINGRNLYTYNFFETTASDTSSNYIRVFKLSGTYGTNNGIPEQSEIVMPSPKYTKYNFLWTYSIKNSYKLIFTDIYNTITEYMLEGYAPFFTPNLNINGVSWQYNYFSNIGALSSQYSTLDVERIYKAIRPIDLSYNTGVLTLTIPEQDQYDISYNFIKRYHPDNREGTRYLKDAIDKTTYIHLFEDNEIVKLTYNIYIFINEDPQYGLTSTGTPINLSDVVSTKNTSVFPYGDTFVDISYNELVKLNDNASYLQIIPKSNIDYGDVPYNGTNNFDVSRNRYNNENDIDGTPQDVSAHTIISNDTINKYFAYESNANLNIDILRIRRNDLINLPYYGHLVSTVDWDITYKMVNVLPDTTTILYDMSSNNYCIRWNYTIQRYNYDKYNPIDYKQSYYDTSSLHSGISNKNEFDFTEFGKRVYPNSILDISYTTLPYLNGGSDPEFFYRNLNASLPSSILSNLSTNLFFNHNKDVRARITVHVLKPDTINGSDQQNNYDTSDISYNLFDLSYSFYDPNRTVPETVIFDISENSNPDSTLLSGQYIFEWDYEIIQDGGVSADYLPFDKTSGGEYQVNSTVFDVPYNDFLYDLSGVYVYSNSDFTNLFLEFAQEDIERFVDYIKIYHTTLDASNTHISFDFNLFSPNKEASQTSGNFWSLPPGYQGRDDPRLYQTPTTYFNKAIVPSPELSYTNINRYGDIGFDIINVSYIGKSHEFYRLTNTYDISNTTNESLGSDISDNLSNVKTYIVEMSIPEGEINNTDISANWGIGSIPSISPTSMTITNDGTHLGIVTDASNQTIVYFTKGNAYYLENNNGRNITGKVRWLMEEQSNGEISVTVTVNNKKGLYLSNLGAPANILSYLGTDNSDVSQNNSTIKIYDKRPDTDYILLSDISRTDIIFHQLRNPTFLGGTTTFPQSHIHTNSTFQIPYICRMDYKIQDKTNNFQFQSIIKTDGNSLNDVYHRDSDWDISYNLVNNTNKYFFNRTAEKPFYHKYIYGVGFISPIEYDVIDFYYPGKLNLEFNSRNTSLILEIPDSNVLGLKFNLVGLWNAVNDNTTVKFRYFGWNSKGQNITNLISGGLDPNSLSDISNVVTELSGADYTVNNVDFLYQVESNTYYEFNFPQIPKSVFIINEENLRSGVYYIAWTYVINNTWNVDKIPPSTDYDLSMSTIVIPPFIYKPGNVDIEIQEDLSQVTLTLSEQTLLDMSRNIYFKNFDTSDISEVKINYFVWTPNDVYTQDNSNGWILPDDYKGTTDIRIREFPAIYYDETTQRNTFYDISYNAGYGLDKTKAYVKTTTGKNLNDMSSVIFTPSDFGLNELPYSSRYNKNGNMVPYICAWNYELVMETTSEYNGVSVQSDISDNSDPTYLFRDPNWNIIYDSSNNASFQESIYNKYLYNSYVLIETIVPPPLPEVFNSYRCTDGGCEKQTTKTTEQKTFVQRYASLFNVDFRLASKMQFDCNKK